jgi:hypothetical protein
MSRKQRKQVIEAELREPSISRQCQLLDEAAIAAEKSRKSGYNSHHCPIPGTIKQREAYHEPS